MSAIKVMLVDDHAILRTGLASLLGTKREIEVVGEADNGETALKLIPRLKPDVVLLDLMMPKMDGSEATRQIRERFPKVKVLILTSYGEADGVAHALEYGASGALLKTIKLPELVTAIRTAVAGGRIVSPEIEQSLTADAPIPQLSERQAEILESVIRGLSNDDISLQLGLSKPRVKEHVKNIFNKIGAGNRAEAVAIALRKQLLKM